ESLEVFLHRYSTTVLAPGIECGCFARTRVASFEEGCHANGLSPAPIAFRADPVAARGARTRLRDGDVRPRAELSLARRDESRSPARQVADPPRRRRRASRV